MNAALQDLVRSGVIGAGEVHATATLARLAGIDDPLVLRAVAMAYWAPVHGHVCVELDRIAQVIAAAASTEQRDGEEGTELWWPPLEEWLTALRSSAAVRAVEHHETLPALDDHPLVLHGSRLYLQRQWIDECRVAAALLARCTDEPAPLAPGSGDLLDALFDASSDTHQRHAAEVATESRLAVVVGGPGTGKTYTVARALAAAVAGASADRPLRVALCAPTGKAAQRLGEAIAAVIGSAVEGERLPSEVAAALVAARPTTVHRLLGPLPGTRTRFRHGPGSPLPHDLVVVDEASMVALPLMARLLEAIRANARLVLVGDPDQLDSVEAGAVLGDVVRAGQQRSSPLERHVVRLHRPRRYEGSSMLGRIADAIAAGDADGVVQMLRAATTDPLSGIRFSEHPDPLGDPDAAGVRSLVEPAVLAAASSALHGAAAEAAAQLAAVRILCAHRRGRYGAAGWNAAVESWAGFHGTWYPGRSVLVTRNDVRTGLVNGDVGVVVGGGQRPMVAFPSATLRTFEPAQLDHVDTAFATTIHKSQGSEHAAVAVVLPPPGSPLLTRELLYTAVTRSRGQLIVAGTVESVHRAVSVRDHRMTGLATALAG